jgi:hypothetical protein
LLMIAGTLSSEKCRGEDVELPMDEIELTVDSGSMDELVAAVVALDHTSIQQVFLKSNCGKTPLMSCALPLSMLLPDANSPELHLSHPTPDECVKIWTGNSASWRDSLTVPVYLEESLFLTTVPLAKDGGMTNWVLVDKNLPPGRRSILCSSESFRKRALTSDADGNVSDAIVHGIASVFCPPAHRGQGFALRMMRELAKVLHTWQSGNQRCIGSILYSDIGKEYYGKLGWRPNLTNFHIEFQPSTIRHQHLAQLVSLKNIAELCHRDEVMIRKAMAISAQGIETRMSIIPDLDHMLWHINKEEFVCKELFGKVPHAKGAIAGPPGSQIWAIWAHRYYGHPDAESTNNTLYILRIVFENQTLGSSCLSVNKKKLHAEDYHKQVGYLKAVLEAAQAEAAEWRLDQVQLWGISPAVRDMVVQTGIGHVLVERQQDGIVSGLWYDASGGEGEAPHWLNNEYYAWC